MKTLACALVLAGGCAVDAPTPVPGMPADTALVQLQLTTTGVPGAPPVATLSTQLPVPRMLWVELAKIELESQAGTWQTLSTGPLRFDAMAFAGGASLLLGDAEVPAGIYRALRLTFDSATLVVGPAEQPLDMASGISLIPLDNALGGGGAYDVALGFDVADSMWPDSNGYAMAPHVDVEAIVAE
ncbi:MAG: DUF4382 domain-containing protein [Acidobacteriota bacterium]